MNIDFNNYFSVPHAGHLVTEINNAMHTLHGQKVKVTCSIDGGIRHESIPQVVRLVRITLYDTITEDESSVDFDTLTSEDRVKLIKAAKKYLSQNGIILKI